MSSSSRVNYSIRVNKAIERKIISEGLGHVISKLGAPYKYIGFGSLWFVDFIHFHKVLKIHDMVSIERDQIIYERADYNKPFSCIELIRGESSKVLTEVLSKTKNPAIIWLDYDDNIFQCSSYRTDVDTIVNNCMSGSVLIVTMNIVNSLIREMKRQAEAKGELSQCLEAVKEMLRNTFGMVKMDGAKIQDFHNPDKFGRLVHPFFSETLENSVYASGNQKQFNKIFDFSYADNAEMLTQGFLILDKNDTEKFGQIVPFASSYFLNTETFRIAAPVLTTREKYSIDKTLPSSDINKFIDEAEKIEHDSDQYLRHSSLGFPLQIDTIKSYSQLYKYYPTFTEILGT